MNGIVSEFLSHPMAFCGGFISGLLRWDLSREPLKSWLADQGVEMKPDPPSQSSSGPKNISID